MSTLSDITLCVLCLLFAMRTVYGEQRIFSKPPPDMKLSWSEIVEKNGFIPSNYTVTTEDGYKLTIMRISTPEDGLKKRPIFF